MKKNIKNQADISGSLASISKLISVYMRTTGSSVCVYDGSSKLVSTAPDGSCVESKICKYCPLNVSDNGDNPCLELHSNAVEESRQSGGTHIYTCTMGLAFWISPLFHEGCFSGCLRGSGYLQSGALIDTTQVSWEFAELLAKLKTADPEKIKSMAEMLLLCAASLSQGSENYHDVLRRRAEQRKEIDSRLAGLKAAVDGGKMYPIKKEQELVSALRLGNRETAASSLNDLLAALLYANSDNFKYMQIKALELAALASRADKDSGKTLQNSNCPFVRQLKKSETFEELADTLHSLIREIAETIAPFRSIPHAAAMRKAERYIQENYTRKILLSEIAAVAELSAPYFSTIFREEMGENFSTYLNRLRVEKAKLMLLETNFTLNEIANACCFEDQSWFSRIFKTFTGLSPGRYRQQGGVFVRH